MVLPGHKPIRKVPFVHQSLVNTYFKSIEVIDSVRNIKHSIQMHNGPCIFIEQIIDFKIIIAPFIDSPMFNVKYLLKHKVQIRV